MAWALTSRLSTAKCPWPHRLGQVRSIKNSEQGEGSHADKGRGAGEAGPCKAGAQRHALQGQASRPLSALQVRSMTGCMRMC